MKRSIIGCRFYLLFLLFTLTRVAAFASPEIIPPGKIYGRSFAIVIDTESFQHTRESVLSYKQMLESERLSVYVLVDEWQTPEEVRTALKALYHLKPQLEGAVFIGNIPVAMIRQAQHMTTAFKMNEDTFPRQESSVASDRFYDDFDLEFEYIGPDEEHPLWHYYNLTSQSVQAIDSDIYSGRIKPLENNGDPYEQINAYLSKVVAQRKERNQLNHLFSFLGYGYNSECMVAWASDKIALSQQFPQAGLPGNSFRYLGFNMAEDVKTYLINELQREELDLAVLNKHGSVAVQHLSGGMPVNSYRDYVFRIQQAMQDVENRDVAPERMQVLLRNMGIPLEWMGKAEFAGDNTSAEQRNRMGNMYVDDIKSFTPNARLIILDACYNGSFHHPQNIAGAYIFNPGKTLVAVGNSVNVLQDNIPSHYLGMLSYGLRIGHIRQQVNTLESHIIGDPTFYFHPSADAGFNALTSLDQVKAKTWRKHLASQNPDLAAFALRMLGRLQPEGHSLLLLDTYKQSPWYSLRLECLFQLNRFNDANYHQVLKLSASDPYELIRRLGASWMGKKGHAEYIPLLVNTLLQDPFYLRASLYNATDALNIFESEQVVQELQRQLASRPLADGERAGKAIEDNLRSNEARRNAWVNTMRDKSLEDDQRINAIRFIRNYNMHHHVDAFCELANQKTESDKLRLVMIEALGWFVTSIEKQQIIDCCKAISADAGNSDVVRAEARKTMRRIR